MNANAFLLSSQVLHSAVKITYAPQMEMLTLEPARTPAPTVEPTRPFAMIALLFLVFLLGVGMVGRGLLRYRARRHLIAPTGRNSITQRNALGERGICAKP